MKKALLWAFIALVLTVMVFHAMPVNAVEFSFNGEYRIRAYAFDMDARKNADDARTYWDQRFRLVMNVKVNDSLKGVIRVLAPNNDQWGTQADYDSGNPWAGGVDYDLAYLEFAIPNSNLSARVGKQYLSLGNYIVLGSYSTFDTLMLTTKLENIDIALFTAKLYEGDISDEYYYDTNSGALTSKCQSEDDEDLYGVSLSINSAPNANIGLFGVMGNDSNIYKGFTKMGDALGLSPAQYMDMDAYWLGATADIDYAPLKIKIEADYSNLNINSLTGDDDIKVKGYALFGDICADLGVAKAGIAALYTTGDNEDDSAASGNFHRFTSISSRFSYMYDWDLMVINKYRETSDGGDQCISNLTTYKLYAMKDFTPKTNGLLSVQSYKYSKDPLPSDLTRNTKLGYEVDLVLSHQLYDNLTLKTGAAYWMTDKDTFPSNDDSSPDDNWLLKAGLLCKF